MDAIHLPNAISLPTAFGAPGTPLPPGQVVQALVLELIQGDVFRLQLPQAVVDVKSDVPLVPGSTVTLAVKGTGANTRLVIFADDAIPAPAVAAAPPTLAGKHPIGEAVIVARAPAAGRAVEPPVVHDAPPTSPVRAPDAPASRNVTPQQALGDAVRIAATRQSGFAPLFADLEQTVQAAQETLPAPVRAAAGQVLALRVPLDAKLTAADVKQAFVRSGVLLEPRLAAEAAVRAPDAQRVDVAAPATDLKAALIVFRQVLKAWTESAPAQGALPDQAIVRPALSDTASLKHLANALAGAPDELPAAPPLSPEQATSLAKSVGTAMLAHEDHAAHANPGALPPPYRGAPLAGQQPALPSIGPDTPVHEAAERLLGATDGAIARTTLLQAASLPDQQNPQRSDPAAQRWSFEVPFVTPQGTGIAQFEVSRDGRPAKAVAQAPVWRARFSLDIEPMGPVHALIAIAGQRASVSLWAERQATAARLNEHAPLLNEALHAAELEPADLQFRVGKPPLAARAATPGRFMDRAT